MPLIAWLILGGLGWVYREKFKTVFSRAFAPGTTAPAGPLTASVAVPAPPTFMPSADQLPVVMASQPTLPYLPSPAAPEPSTQLPPPPVITPSSVKKKLMMGPNVKRGDYPTCITGDWDIEVLPCPPGYERIATKMVLANPCPSGTTENPLWQSQECTSVSKPATTSIECPRGESWSYPRSDPSKGSCTPRPDLTAAYMDCLDQKLRGRLIDCEPPTEALQWHFGCLRKQAVGLRIACSDKRGPTRMFELMKEVAQFMARQTVPPRPGSDELCPPGTRRVSICDASGTPTCYPGECKPIHTTPSRVMYRVSKNGVSKDFATDAEARAYCEPDMVLGDCAKSLPARCWCRPKTTTSSQEKRGP